MRNARSLLGTAACVARTAEQSRMACNANTSLLGGGSAALSTTCLHAVVPRPDTAAKTHPRRSLAPVSAAHGRTRGAAHPGIHMIPIRASRSHDAASEQPDRALNGGGGHDSYKWRWGSEPRQQQQGQQPQGSLGTTAALPETARQDCHAGVEVRRVICTRLRKPVLEP